MKMKKVSLALALAGTCAIPASSGQADEGYPTPIVGNCNYTLPGPRQIDLFQDNNFSGGCWRLTLPEGTSFARIRNVTELGIPNDWISSARVGADLRVEMFEHHFWGGRVRVMKGNVSPNWNPVEDNDFRNFTPVYGFQDMLTSLTMIHEPF
jgi:hypothetical protein